VPPRSYGTGIHRLHLLGGGAPSASTSVRPHARQWGASSNLAERQDTFHRTASEASLQRDVGTGKACGHLIAIGLMIACTAPVMRAGPSVKNDSHALSLTISSVAMFSRM
jgi:hypothetical protein